MMLKCIISGGQTGIDQAAWRAARAAGLVTDGWMPRGFLTEEGPRPEFAEMYGAREHVSPDYPPRTRQNILDSEATFLVYTPERSPGTTLTHRILCEPDIIRKHPHAVLTVGRAAASTWEPMNSAYTPGWLANWVARSRIRVLNVAGPRESRNPGIGAWAERYFSEMFRLLKDEGDEGGSAR